jgi:hypothetical protein
LLHRLIQNNTRGHRYIQRIKIAGHGYLKLLITDL